MIRLFLISNALFTILAFTVFAAASSTPTLSENLKPLEHWVIFPFADIDTKVHQKVVDKIKSKKKYTVIDDQYLFEKDLNHPRKTLSKDDIKKISADLQADLLITGFGDHGKLFLTAYSPKADQAVWAISGKPQNAEDMISVLLEKVPYDGFVITDPLIGKPVYQDGPRQLALVDFGDTSDLSKGEPLQWISFSIPEQKITVLAEGHILKVKRGIVEAEIQKVTDLNDIQEKTLVRFSRFSPSPALNSVRQENSDKRKNGFIFGSIFSVVAIVLLAL